jgi:hypothetical protein
MIEFEEVSPGLIITRGGGAPDRPFIMTQETLRRLRSPADLWQKATERRAVDGGYREAIAAMPAALAAAVERFETLGGTRSNPRGQPSPMRGGPASAPPAVVAIPQASTAITVGTGGDGSSGYCDDGYFRDGFSRCNDGDQGQFCRDDWANGYLFNQLDIEDVSHYEYWNVCPKGAPVVMDRTFRLGPAQRYQDTFLDSSKQTWVPANTVYWEQAYSVPDCGFFSCDDYWSKGRMEIQQASGIHFAIRVMIDR